MARGLLEHLDAGALCLGVEAADAEAVIRLLAGRLHAAGHVADSFADAVVAREATMPTGLPLGHAVNVAIPHTDPHHVVRPAVAMASLARPVAFANMEDADEALEVGLVFLLALKDKDAQIDMLQEIIAIVQSPRAIALLMEAGDAEAVRAALASEEDQTG